MRTRSSWRAWRALPPSLLVAALGVALWVSPVAGGAAACELTVTPSEGRAGTAFTFSGSGFTATQLTLSRDGKPGTAVALNLGNADPFKVTITSRPGDEGAWKAVATAPGVDCAPEATFRVTLPSTATDDIGDTAPAVPAMPTLVGAILAALAFAGGFHVGRLRDRR